MPDVVPFILQKPTIALGPVATEVEIQCSANQVEAAPEQDETTVETFCGTYTTYKPEVWTITIGALQSFGDDGLWTLVRPLVGTTVPFRLLPDSRVAASVDNPQMEGMATVKAFAFLNAEVGEASEFDLELAVQGEPTFTTTPGVTTLADEGEPEPEYATAAA